MRDNELPHTANASPEEPLASEALIGERRGFSPIWLLPLLAALLGAWLIWRNFAEAGITVTLLFEDGAGITPQQTSLRYEGITVGMVTEMNLQSDLTGVVVTLEVDRSAEPLLREQTQFWLVSPQVSLGGITGLETLVSGNYITLRPGDGSPHTEFAALSREPGIDGDGPGLHLSLAADDLGSLSIGSPVSFQKVEVGSVQGYALREDGQGVDIKVVIKPEYSDLVNSESRFWNASGIEISGGLRGFEVHTGSLVSLLRGGIVFNSPASGEAVSDGAKFRLYPNRGRAAPGIRIKLRIPDPEGIQPGQTEIRYRGFRLGQIESLKLNPDDPYAGALAVAHLTPETESYLRSDAHFWIVRPQLSAEGVSGLDALLGGPYIELAPGRSDQPQRSFELLEQPPVLSDNAPGLQLWLRTESLDSVARGAAVYFRRIKVGTVQDFTLRKQGDGIDVRIHIDEQYAHLVTERSRFWNASGFDISGGLDGIQVRAESLAAILAGGIAFSTAEGGTAVSDNHIFHLYDSRDRAEERGVFIDVYLHSGDGLKVGSALKYQGVKVGEITRLRLAADLGGVVAQIRLDQQAEAIAREGSRFWVARPEFGLIETRNLDALIGGSYLVVTPGHGAAATQFASLGEAPVIGAERGLPILVEASQLGSIRRGLKVYYRGVAVGVVAGYRLADPADKVEIELRIEPRYASLVRESSRFFSVSGLKIDASLFNGLRVDAASIETLVAGGIGFATPADSHAQAKPYSRFPLHTRPDPGWLDWQPGLRLDREPSPPAL